MTDRTPADTRKRVGLVTLAIASAAVVAAAAPRVMAQTYDDNSPSYSSDDGVPTDADLTQRMSEIQYRIDRAASDGDLTRLQVSRDMDELANIRTQAAELRRRDGELTMTDRQFIDTRLDRLEGRVDYAMNEYRP
jgi:hypothetical protein